MVEIKYFVHATTVDNLEKKAAGWLHGELSEIGVKQAIELGEIIKDEYFDAVFCSDLKRAVDSANIVFAGRNIEIISDDRIRECNYGDYNGLDSKLADYSSHIEDRFPGGENMYDVEKRIKCFLEYLKENYNNKKIAIVAHKAPQLALDVLLVGKTWNEAIKTDWRLSHAWQPGWTYTVE